MNVTMKRTSVFYVFGSPVTVKKTENIVMDGLEGEYLLICSPYDKKARVALASGTVTIKPYEMSYGIHELYTVDKRGVSIPVGTVGILADSATLGEVCIGDAINKLALFSEDIRDGLASVTKRVAKLEAERHQINLLDKEEE